MAKKSGITIIDKTKPPSSKFIFSGHPATFNTKLEETRFVEEEFRRWIEGYGGLSGPHYYYLTQGHLKLIDGKITRPEWRDCDEWIIDGFLVAKNQQFNFGLVSRRELAKTSIGGGLFPNYFIRTNPGCRVLLTSCDKKRVFTMFNDKTMVFYDNLHKRFRGRISNENRTQNQVYIKVEYPIINDNGETKKVESDIFCAETSDGPESPKAFSSARGLYGYYDEFPLHKRGKELLQSSEACYMKNGVKEGTLFWAGTIEKDAPQESINRIRELLGDSKNSNTLLLFAPYWWGLKMVNGNSDEKAGTEWWEKECERRAKLSDKTDLPAFIKNFPPTIESALGSSTNSVLPAECMTIINSQRDAITTSHIPIMQYDLIRGADGSVVYRANKDGKFHILTMPDQDKEYSSGTDPIPFGKLLEDQEVENCDKTTGSKYAIIIYEDDTETPVAYYMERSLNADIVVNNCILLQDFYFGTKTMMETNKSDVPFRIYKDLEATELLASRPTTLGIKFVDKKSSKGYYKNDATTARTTDLFIKYILRYGANIWFKELISDAENFAIKNTDLLDAFLACLLMRADKIGKKTKQMAKPVYREFRELHKGPDGKMNWEWVTRRVDGAEQYEES